MKIAVCIPTHGDTKAYFTVALARMLVRSAQAKIVDGGKERSPRLQVFQFSSPNLVYSRNQLIEQAAAWGADWILWLDADHVFPTDALLRLLAHHRTVVACNYPARFGGAPVALKRVEDGVREVLNTTPAKAAEAPLEEALITGLGVCLVSMTAVRSIKGPAFSMEYFEDGRVRVGEDAWFFGALREVGHPLFIDHALSMEVGHIAERVLRFPK